jgi:uncharacterized membrane protein (UPF0127 family)
MPHAGRALAAALVVAAFGSCAADDGTGFVPPRIMTTTVGTSVVQAELATTFAERQAGLMERTSLPDTAGMIFVFSGDAIRDFWMKDTPINLSIAFIDSTKTIINVQEMTAFDEQTIHHSTGPARYALEMKEGWFTARGYGPGTKATFTLPPGLRIDP